MTNSELKKLNRADLLQALVDAMKEKDSLLAKKERLQAQLDELAAQMEKRDRDVQESESLAEASLKVNGAIEAARTAAQEYLANIKRMNKSQDEDYRAEIEDAESQAEEIIRLAEKECARIEAEAEAYSKDVSDRIACFSEDHKWFARFIK